MNANTLVLVILILLVVGALPAWPYSHNWGFLPGGFFGIVLLILLVRLL